MKDKVSLISKNFKAVFGMDMAVHELYRAVLTKADKIKFDYLYASVGDSEVFKMLSHLDKELFSDQIDELENKMREEAKSILTESENKDTLNKAATPKKKGGQHGRV